MKSGLSDTNPVIVAAFKAALLHQGLVIAALLVLLALAWVAARGRCAAGSRGGPRHPDRLAARHRRLDTGPDRPGAYSLRIVRLRHP